jgi:hypothetical protein
MMLELFVLIIVASISPAWAVAVFLALAIGEVFR